MFLKAKLVRFGQWIYDKGMLLFGQLPEMRQLEKVQKEIHHFASELVKLKQEKQTEKAINQLSKPETLANGIFELLKKINEKAGLV